MTYQTNNPVGSVDVRDLYDNAQNLDNFSNGPLDAYPDRFGVSRQSLQGIRNASQYVNLGPYAAGLNFTALNQVFSYDAGSGAEFYAPGPSITLPYTTTGAGAGEIANFRSVGDAILRADLAASDGAELVGYGGRSVAARLDDARSVLDFGAVADGATDDSAAAVAMLAELNMLVVPSGRTVVLKDIELQAGAVVRVHGGVKLPGDCADFDRMFYAVGKPGLRFDINEINGNATEQSGNIGTYLVYLVECHDAVVDLAYAHDHYIASGAETPPTDGVRGVSTGAVFLYRCDRATVKVGLLSGWGREGIYLEECNHSTASLGHAQGTGLTEYSGLQVKGKYNSVERASVDNAGASAVGFDTMYGSISNVIATNTRENAGVNFGHTGFPATGSVASNIVVDGAYKAGISVGASSQDVVINGFSIRNCGEIGINVSDEVQRARISNGSSEYNGAYNLYSSVAQVELRNTKYGAVDVWALTLTDATGLFVDGETVTQGAATGVVRKVLRNLDGSKQILLMQSMGGGWDNAAITGATSGATATIVSGAAPTTKREDGGGRFTEESARFSGGSEGTIETLPSGTRIFTKSLIINATAGAIATVSENFPAFSSFVSAPQIQLTLLGGNDTDSFDISRLDGTATLSGFTVKLKASATQPYGVSIQAIGNWR